MIQRIQSIYLLLAGIVAIVGAFLPILSLADGGSDTMSAYSAWGMLCEPVAVNLAYGSFLFPLLLFGLMIGTALLSFVIIFLYQNRNKQFMLCSVNIALLGVWYVIYAVIAYFALVEGALGFSFGWAIAMPAVSIVLLILARKAIRHDEELVRAADRIR